VGERPRPTKSKRLHSSESLTRVKAANLMPANFEHPLSARIPVIKALDAPKNLN
jgi:hypothetical protein